MFRFLICFLLGGALTAADLIEVETPLWQFNESEQWTVWWKGEVAKPFRLSPQVDGTDLVIDAGEVDLSLPFFATKGGKRLSLGTASRLMLAVDMMEGVDVSIGLNIIDDAGMGAHLGVRPLVAGSNILQWDLDAKPMHTWGTHHDGALTPPLRLWDFAVKRGAGVASQLHFRNAKTWEQRRPVDCLSLSLETGSPIHVLTVGHEDKLQITVHNSANVVQQVALTSHWRDAGGRSLQAADSLQVPAEGSAVWKPAVTLDRRGAWQVDCTARVGDTTMAERFWIARLDATQPRQGRSDGFLFGICGGLVWPDKQANFQRNLAALAQCGARVVRGGINWEYVELAQGQWREDWFPWFASELQQLDAIGIECQFLLCYTSKWAAPVATRNAENMTDWLFAPPDPQAWRGYVRKMATTFAGKIRFWEVWNETDITNFWPGTNEQYLEILDIAQEELRKADPAAQVLTSGFAILAGHGGKKDPDFAKKVVSKARAHFDILALHLHGSFPYFRWQLDELLPPLVEACASPVPIYFNETAVNVDEFGEWGQAEHFAKKLLYAWGKGAMGYTWYNLKSGARVPIPGGDRNWGLLTEDWYPRPVYSAFATLAHELADVSCDGFVEAGPENIMLSFRQDADFCLAGWYEDASMAMVPHVIHVAADATVTAVDLMGNRQDIVVHDGRVLWSLGTVPSLLWIHRSKSAPQLEAPLLIVPSDLLAIPGRSYPLTVTLRNPFQTPQRIAVQWELPEGWRAEAASKTEYVVAAGEQLTVQQEWLVPSAGLMWGTAAVVRADILFPELTWQGSAQIPVAVGLMVPEGSFKNRPCDISLTDRSYVTNLNDNVPQRLHLTWQGVDDLSARIWIGRQDNRLALQVIVQDDIHRQSHAGAQIWQGDAIQFAFSIPGQDGWWEMGLARDDQGQTQSWTWLRPKGQSGKPMASAQGRVERDATSTRYEWSLPFAELGLSPEQLRAGIRFNLAVHDNDSDQREGWMQVSAGIADRKSDKAFTVIRLE